MSVATAAAITAKNSNVLVSNDGDDVLSGVAELFVKYIYENPLMIFEDSPTLKRYSLIAIHAVLISVLVSLLPDKMIFVAYASAFWLGFLILMIYLTDNLYDTTL